jgi:outer membrane protein
MNQSSIDGVKRFRGMSLRSTALAAALFALLNAGSASAESLTDALSAAYQANPVLAAERAQLRATDEQVAQAVSGWRPTLSAQGTYGYQRTDSTYRTPGAGALAGGTSGTTHPLSGSVTLSQNVFEGFRTVGQTAQAKHAVEAGRNNLLSVEQQTLLAAVQAYTDVIRDLSVVKLNQNNLKLLKKQLGATRDRFEVGELTRTDVAQSEARLSGARSQLRAAEAGLTASRAAYERVVGNAPGTLTPPPPAEGLPQSEEEARNLAEANNPDIKAAREIEAANREAVGVAKGALLPTFDVQASFDRVNDPSSGLRNNEQRSVLGVVTIPLYQSGAEYSRVREAKEFANRARMQIIATERLVEERVRTAWEGLRAARSVVTSSREQVKANRIALEGVGLEAEVGSQTTLDVLNATQELLNAQVLLVTAERDVAVAEFGLLAAVGQLTARNLELPVQYYDPEANYREVSGKWIGFGTEGDE